MRSTATHSSLRSAIVSRIKCLFPLLVLALFVVGCQTGQLSDPNDVSAAGDETPLVIQAQLDNAAASLNDRKANREINDRQYQALITQIARDYVSKAKDTTITNENAGAWGNVYITAKEWPQAEAALTVAIKLEQAQATADYLALGRLMTYKLQLARVDAEMGNLHDAVVLARSVFDVPPKAKAPILTSVLYDIVPAGIGKGSDLELADLLKDAIAQHENVLVDPSTNSGRDFLLARPHHIQKAWEVAAFLYKSAGRADLAQQAASEAHRADTTNIHV